MQESFSFNPSFRDDYKLKLIFFSNQSTIFDVTCKFNIRIVRATTTIRPLFISSTYNLKCVLLIDNHCYEVITLE